MRRPVGVIVGGILLGLIALLGTVVELLALGVSIFSHSPVIPKLPGVRVAMIGFTALELAFFVFCGWTTVGLFRIRRWARTAAIVIAGVVTFFSATTGLGILMARRYTAMLPPGPESGDVDAALVGIAVFCFVLALISIWWIVYFNFSSIRRTFVGEQTLAAGGTAMLDSTPTPPEPRTSGWRIVIVIWAWLALLSMLWLPMALWMGTPLILFGVVLSGSTGKLAFLILCAVEVYMGIGLLRKWKPAWYVALFVQVFAIGNSAAFLIPSVRVRYLGVMQQVLERSSGGLVSPAPYMSTAFIGTCFAFGLILVLVLTWALIRRREDYFHG